MAQAFADVLQWADEHMQSDDDSHRKGERRKFWAVSNTHTHTHTHTYTPLHQHYVAVHEHAYFVGSCRVMTLLHMTKCLVVPVHSCLMVPVDECTCVPKFARPMQGKI